MEYKDYYEILGLARTADQDEIKRAYRRLARKYHPDVSSEPEAEDHFKDVAEAYEVLGDPEKRQAYDELGSNWMNGQSFQPPPDWQHFFGGSDPEGDAAFSDFFSSIFGGGGFSQQRGPFRGRDRHASIEVTLEQLADSTPVEVAFEVVEHDGGRPVRRTKRLKVNIPGGLRDGESFRLRGQGEPGVDGGRPGDLYLALQIREHPVYTLAGHDIYSEVTVAPHDAVLGTTLTVSTLSGTVHLKVPVGSHSGKKLRLRERGLDGGDHYVVIRVDLPRHMSDEEVALYEQIAALHERGVTS